MDRGNLDYAMEMFLNALEVEPGFLEGRRYLRAASLKKFKKGGKGKIAHLISSLTGMPAALAARAKMGKKPLAALLAAERLLIKDPLNPSFVYLLCDAAYSLSMPEVAVQSLEVLRDDNPDDPRVMEHLAEAYRENDQMADARSMYERLLAKRPNDQGLIKKYKDTTALATMQKGGWGKATTFRDVMKDADGATSIETEGKAVKSESDIQRLVAETEAKIVQEPGNINYRRALADLLTKAGRIEDALVALKNAQEVTGGGDPQIDRMVSSLRISMFDNEITTLREGGDEAGAAAREQEREAFVLADARDRVKRYPNDRDFKFELGELLVAHGEIDDAIQQFQQSQRSPKRRIQSLFKLGQCFKQKGLNDLAREQLATAVEELPNMDGLKKDILYELGAIAEAMGDSEEAARLYTEIYAADIGFRDVAAKVDQSHGQG